MDTSPPGSRCHEGACSSQLYSARLGSYAFDPLPGTAYADGSASSIAISSGRAYIGAFYGYFFSHGVGHPRQALLTGPANRIARWHKLPLPGRLGECGQFGMYVAASGSRLILGCVGEPGGLPPGPMQHKWIWLSSNGARTWHQATSPPAIPGYMTDLSVAPPAVIAESGDRAGVHMSWNAGRTWHTSPSLSPAYQATGGAGLAATMVTGSFGYALVGDLYLPKLYLTRNSGHTWTPCTVH